MGTIQPSVMRHHQSPGLRPSAQTAKACGMRWRVPFRPSLECCRAYLSRSWGLISRSRDGIWTISLKQLRGQRVHQTMTLTEIANSRCSAPVSTFSSTSKNPYSAAPSSQLARHSSTCTTSTNHVSGERHFSASTRAAACTAVCQR